MHFQVMYNGSVFTCSAKNLVFIADDFHLLPKLIRLGLTFLDLLLKLENRVKTWILDSINNFDDGVKNYVG